MTDIQQGSEEWFAIRRGKVTASKIADLMAKTKSGWGASRKNYEAQLIAERLTGNTAETFKSSAMDWGNEVEPEARSAYEFFQNETVEEIGFVDHPKIEMSGASPDGLVGDNGLIEIKCPNTATHIDTWLGQSIPSKYIKQMQWQMDCCGREWCDFVSYDPRMPEHLQLYVQRVHRDPELIQSIRDHVEDFLGEIDAKVQQLNPMKEAAE